jgi:hypothetical protein
MSSLEVQVEQSEPKLNILDNVQHTRFQVSRRRKFNSMSADLQDTNFSNDHAA